MKHHWLRCLSLLLIGLLWSFESAAQGADIAAVRDVQAQQAAAWNRHDAAAYAELFTKDGDVVNVLGWWWKGPTEIQSKLSDAFVYVFRESTLTITEVDVRFLDPKCAVAHVRWSMEGAKVPPGAPAPPRSGIQVQVLQKQGDRWQIATLQNTNSVPEAPFPKGPPSPPAPTK
jgi:uncharacterized protein (TIGR02246 family)